MHVNKWAIVHYILTGLLLAFVSAYAELAYASTLLDRFTGTFNDRTIQIDLTEDDAQGRPKSSATADIPLRYVRITCLHGCAKSDLYGETMIDAPLSVFRIDDNSNDVISLWEGGTAYVVRVYRILDGSVKKVFEHSSNTFPQFIYVKAGAPAIILNGEDMSAPIHVGSTAEIWKLTKGEYERMPLQGD